MRRSTVGAMFVLSLAVGAGCGGAPAGPTTPSTPARDSMNSLTNMSPAIDTVLQPGQTVTISGTAAYTLATTDVGGVIMVIQDQADRPIQNSGVAAVQRGTGEVTLSQTITVPADGVTAVRVYFALMTAGATSTNAVLRVTYLVR